MRVERAVYTIISAVLSATISAKLWSILDDPFADLSIGLPLPIIWAVIFFESTILATIVLANKRFRWLAATFAFSVFTAASSWAILTGKSCGCAGSIEIPSHYFFLLDVGVLIALRQIKPKLSADWFVLASYKLKHYSGGLIGIGAAVAVFSIVYSLDLLPSSFGLQRNSRIKLQTIELGEVVVGETTPFFATVENDSSRSRVVVGARPSCSCIVQDILRKEVVAAGETQNIRFLLTPLVPGPLQKRILFYFDGGEEQVLAVDVFGTVIEKPDTISISSHLR